MLVLVPLCVAYNNNKISKGKNKTEQKLTSARDGVLQDKCDQLRLLTHFAIAITITQNLKVIDYGYDYLRILQLRLLKVIMCFLIATTEILKRIGRIIFSLISASINI